MAAMGPIQFPTRAGARPRFHTVHVIVSVGACSGWRDLFAPPRRLPPHRARPLPWMITLDTRSQTHCRRVKPSPPHPPPLGGGKGALHHLLPFRGRDWFLTSDPRPPTPHTALSRFHRASMRQRRGQFFTGCRNSGQGTVPISLLLHSLRNSRAERGLSHSFFTRARGPSSKIRSPPPRRARKGAPVLRHRWGGGPGLPALF